MTVTLDEMLALRQVVDTGSISAAAEQMGQTPSGISRALSRLETKLDTSLLHRTTRRLSLTCLLYTSPSPRDKRQSRMPSSA